VYSILYEPSQPDSRPDHVEKGKTVPAGSFGGDGRNIDGASTSLLTVDDYRIRATTFVAVIPQPRQHASSFHLFMGVE